MHEDNEVRVDLNTCAEQDEAFKASLEKVMSIRNIGKEKRESIKQVSRFIQHVWNTESKSIVDVPCGGGKSLWSLALIHSTIERSHSNAEGINPIYLVVDTLKTAKERLSALLAMGIDRDYVGYYHSFQQEECDELRAGNGFSYDQLISNRSLCNDCPVNARCGYFTRYAQLHRPIVIMCHEGLIRLLESGKVRKDCDIIIDEEPNPYYMKSFQRRDVERLVDRLSVHAEGSSGLRPVVDAISELHMWASATSNHRSTKQWSHQIRHEDKLAAYRHLRTALGYSAGSDSNEFGASDPWEDDFLREHHLTLLGDIGYALRDGAETFVYADSSDISIARRRLDLGVPNKILLLNGSASLYRYVLGGGMRVHTCPELKPAYPNVVLHCYECLPTKRSLQNADTGGAFVQFAAESLDSSQVNFIALNKQTDSTGSVGLSDTTTATKDGSSIAERFRRAFPSITPECIGERGTIIGSNQWVDGVVGIVATSLFTDISHYALHASLRHGREFTADEMFLKTPKGPRPRVSKDFHLSPKEVDDEFRRESAHELYQTVMRLRCRQDASAAVHVVVMIPNIELLSELGRLMPGVQVRSGDGFLELFWETVQSRQAVSNEEWYAAIGLSPNSGRNIQKAREIGESFGFNPEKQGGNRVFWVPDSEECPN